MKGQPVLVHCFCDFVLRKGDHGRLLLVQQIQLLMCVQIIRSMLALLGQLNKDLFLLSLLLCNGLLAIGMVVRLRQEFLMSGTDRTAGRAAAQ